MNYEGDKEYSKRKSLFMFIERYKYIVFKKNHVKNNKINYFKTMISGIILLGFITRNPCKKFSW